MPSPDPMDIIVYHNPECGTSRNALAMIRNAGIEPHVIEYLKTPPSRVLLVQLIERAGLTPRELLREKDTPFHELGLGDESLTGDQLVDAMMEHPILINRPLVVSPFGVKLCRPSEVVLDLIPTPQQGALAKEDGEQVVNARGERIQGEKQKTWTHLRRLPRRSRQSAFSNATSACGWRSASLSGSG